jgi:Holliday junction resolvasome RuvABC DNA-binding subunit
MNDDSPVMKSDPQPPAVAKAAVSAPRNAAPAPPGALGDNAGIAQWLREMAALLDAQNGNPYRAAAYRKAADTVAQLPRNVRDLFEESGIGGLDALPAIGPRIAAAIAEILTTGRWGQLQHLRGEADPAALLRTIPGVGPELAHRLHEGLGVETLEALEVAAHDGRLERLTRIGARRAASIRAALTQMLDRRRALNRRVPAATAQHEPSVDWLLDIDREYRAGAQAGTLSKIAPRRFNAKGEAWLPVLHTQRGDWHFTALFSNTARAHELGRVRDWVVIYGEDKAHGERQYTVVTATHGALAGRRVVRGREADCRDWYSCA